MRRFLRELISTGLYLFLREDREGELRVLTYHRVNRTSPKDRLSVHTDSFRKQMLYLARKGYHTLTAEDLSEILRQKRPIPRRSILITFDDGYRDNFTDAYPVLREFGFKATVFVATELVGKTHDGHPMLRWNEIQEMTTGGISLGSHTARHVYLNEVSPETGRRELEDSKRLLETKLGQNVRSFCYPFGDLDGESVAWVKGAGYDIAFTTRPGPVQQSTDPFWVSRTEVSGFDTLFDFRKKLAGAFDWLHRFVQRKKKRERKIGPIPVLYVIWSLGLGGAEQVVLTLAKGLDRRRFKPLVACLNEPGRYAGVLEREGIRVISLHKKGKFDFSIIPKLIRLIREEKIQIVHTHLWGGNVWGRIAAFIARVPVSIATEHGIQEWRGALHRLIDRVLAKVSNRVLFVAESVKEDFCRMTGVSPQKCFVIPNGVDLERFSPAQDPKALRKRLGLPAEGKIALSIGRLSPEKKFDLLISALRSRLLEGELHLVIIGSGREEKNLLALKERFGLDGRVQLFSEQGELEPFYGAADCFIQFSSREALSLALLEAMASGLPVIASAVGDHPKVIRDGVDGFLVPAGDTGELLRKLRILFEDSKAGVWIGQKARETVRLRYSKERMIRETENLYEELMRHD